MTMCSADSFTPGKVQAVNPPTDLTVIISRLQTRIDAGDDRDLVLATLLAIATTLTEMTGKETTLMTDVTALQAEVAATQQADQTVIGVLGDLANKINTLVTNNPSIPQADIDALTSSLAAARQSVADAMGTDDPGYTPPAPPAPAPTPTPDPTPVPGPAGTDPSRPLTGPDEG